MTLKVVPQTSISYPEPSKLAKDLAFKKLASSGIHLDDAKQLGIHVIKASDADPAFNAVSALCLRYHDIDGSDSGFFRVRYLEDAPGFAAQVAKPQRYVQSASTLNWAYLPRVKGLDWSVVANDATMPLLITEGELKAICACQEDFLTIGLGGVTVWRSSKKGVDLLPPLDRFNWKGRVVTIIFDSDAAINPNVAAAQVALAKKLILLGASPKIASLPADRHGNKQGLDDFLVAGGDLAAVLEDTRILALGEHFTDFNSRYSYVSRQDVIIEMRSGTRFKRDSFVNGLHANLKCVEHVPNASGNLKRVESLVAREWLAWPARQDVHDITYRPAESQITTDNYFNSWPGWGCQPKEGSVALWDTFMKFVFSEAPSDRRWFEQWLAYPLQHPGTKLYSGCLFWGPETGTGKSLVGVVMGKIYGENFTVIENADLFGAFNEWAENKQFIMGDEISGTDKRSEADRLKGMVTRLKVRINAKHLPKYEIKDCINYYFTSNHPDSLFLDDKDRRWFVHRMPPSQLQRRFYIDLLRWLDHDGGKEALFHYLLNIDLSGFDPGAPALETTAKLEMIDHSKSELSAWVVDLYRNLDRYLERLATMMYLKEVPDVLRCDDLRKLYDPDGVKKVTNPGLGRALASLFRSVRVQHSKLLGTQRLVVMRNADKWMTASSAELREYIDEAYKPLIKPEKKGKF